MKCKAKYIGDNIVFGINPGNEYTINLYTVDANQGTPYLWIQVDGSQYLMPYVSVGAMLAEWVFEPCAAHDAGIQMELEDHWLDVYIPGCGQPWVEDMDDE